MRTTGLKSDESSTVVRTMRIGAQHDVRERLAWLANFWTCCKRTELVELVVAFVRP